MTALPTVCVEHCPVCGADGPIVHPGTTDQVFGVPGRWSYRRCTGCRSLWLDPRPRDDVLHEAYHDYYTHGDGDHAPGGRAGKRLLPLLPWHADFSRARLGYVGDLPAGRVLDFGCGDGRTSLALQDAGWTVLALDVDPASVRQAAAAGVEDARVGGLEAAAGSGPFDAVVMSHVIEHLPAPLETLREVVSQLHPGGRLAVMTPNADSISRQRFGSAWRGLEPPRHLQVFSPAGLRRVLEEGGLVIDRVRTSPRGANAVARAAIDPRGASAGAEKLRSYAAGERWQARVARTLRRNAWAGEELVAIAHRETT